MTAEEILTRAAEYVEAGWAQGEANLNYNLGPWCAGLALQRAYHADGKTTEHALLEARAAFCREIGISRPDNIPIYNDTPGRTQEEVATALRNAKRWIADS